MFTIEDRGWNKNSNRSNSEQHAVSNYFVPDESRVNCLPLRRAVFLWLSGCITSGPQWVLVLALPSTNPMTLSLSQGMEALVSASERKFCFGSKTLVWVIDSGPYIQELQLFPFLGRSFQESHKDIWRFPNEKGVLMYSPQDHETRGSFWVVMNLSLFVFICPLWGHQSANTDWMKLELMVSKHPGFWDMFRLLKKISTSC